MTPALEKLVILRGLVLAIAAKVAFLAPALTRAVVGWVFLESGWGKLHNLERVTEFFRSLHIPAPEIQAPFVAATELVCGILLLAGLLTRLASVPLIGTMVVAIVTAKADEVKVVSDLFGMSEFLYIALLIWLGVSGPGPLSIDWLLTRYLAGPGREGNRARA